MVWLTGLWLHVDILKTHTFREGTVELHSKKPEVRLVNPSQDCVGDVAMPVFTIFKQSAQLPQCAVDVLDARPTPKQHGGSDPDTKSRSCRALSA